MSSLLRSKLAAAGSGIGSVWCRLSRRVVVRLSVLNVSKSFIFKMSKVTRQDQRRGTRKDRPKKRKPPTPGEKILNMSASAKKLKLDEEIVVPERNVQNKIIDFVLVFTAVSNCVSCSNIRDGEICNGKVKFDACNSKGLGFKILVSCEHCDSRYIESGRRIDQAYEINRRFIFVMRLLGLGRAGCNKFCGLMDISCNFLSQKVYDSYIEKILECVRMVADKLFSFAIKVEKNDMSKEDDSIDSSELTVSGDGTWKKRGFTSLFGVTSIIGHYSGKVLDVFCKSSYCNQCERRKSEVGTAEYEEWYKEHINKNECMANHDGPSGNMETQAVVEMFKRSTTRGVKYKNYIGDGDSKVYSNVCDAKPYGENYVVNKKECVGHVQKRMGKRLRDLVKNTVEEKTVKGKKIKKKLYPVKVD